MLKKTTALFILTCAASLTAFADFTFTDTQKATGGSMAAMAGAAANRTSTYYFKGQKMATSSADITIVVDFGAQTMTTVNNALKTYSVKKLGDVAAAAGTPDVAINMKETGQKKKVNGFDATEELVTMDMDMAMGRGAPTMKMQIEMDLWIAPDVPGSAELRAFYQKNAASMPWGETMGAGSNASIQKAMGQMQQALAKLNGVVVERIIRVKPAAGPAAPQMAQMPQMTPAQMAQMQAGMAKMQEMAKQGGPQAAAAQQAMASMGGMAGMGGGGGGASAALIELTSDSSGFSTGSVADSVFAIPDGFKQMP